MMTFCNDIRYPCTHKKIFVNSERGKKPHGKPLPPPDKRECDEEKVDLRISLKRCLYSQSNSQKGELLFDEGICEGHCKPL